METITNGSGLAVVAAGGRGLQVHGASDASNTYDLITEIDTTGFANAVALASGIAYVADGAGGLQVINFLPFDANGIAPTISINTSAIDADPETDGIQVEEGRSISVSLTAEDDVQVRNVQLLVNGEIVQNDVSAPYDLNFIVPSLTEGVNTIEVEVQAFDTGGNATLSDALTFNIIPDITPPELLSITPANNSLVLLGSGTVQLSFSEGVDPASLSAANIKITTPSDPTVEIIASDIGFLSDGQIAILSFPDLPLGEYVITLDLSNVTDRAGNQIGGDPVVQQFEVTDATAFWTNPAGGNWHDPANWRDGVVPINGDGVAITLNEGASVTYSSGTLDLARLKIKGELILSGGDLSADLIDLNNGFITQRGGILSDSILEGENTTGLFADGGTLNNVTLNTDTLIDASTVSKTVNVSDLTVNGALTLAGSGFTALLKVLGEQTIAGTGEIILSNINATDSGQARNFIQTGNSNSTVDTLTFAEGLTLSGESGTLQSRDGRDVFKILGTVKGEQDGNIQISRINNDGEDLNLDIPNGGVFLSDVISNTTIKGTDGSILSLLNSTLSNVILDIDTIIDASTANRTVSVSDLTVNGAFTLAGSDFQALLSILGEQTIAGTGEIILSNINATDSGLARNFIQIGNSDSTIDTLTFPESLTLRGESGTLQSRDGRDVFKILGTIKLDQDGQITLSQNTQFADSTVFEFDIAGVTDGAFGQIIGSGALTIDGTLRVNLTDGFVPAAGDEFLLFNQDVSSGAFDLFETTNLETSITLIATPGVDGLILLAENTIV